jgi:hypothetical protein
VAQPALGAGDQADRRGGATAARHFAGDAGLFFGALLPRQVVLARRQFVGVRQVEEGRQQRQFFNRARCGQLRDGQHAVLGFSPSLACRFTYDSALCVVPRSMPMA